MAPIKFEEQLKEKLEERRLPPSTESWLKLAARLDDDEKTPKRTIRWWLSIAAGLIILVALAVQLFSEASGNTVLPQVVEEIESEIPMKSNNSQGKQETRQPSTLVAQEAEQNDHVQKSTVSEQKRQKQSSEGVTQGLETENTHLTQLADVDKFSEGKAQKNTVTVSNKEQDIAETEQALAVLANDIQDQNSEAVSEMELDALLKRARKELGSKTVMGDPVKTVNAELLLQSVQDEMGQSFRTRVFEALKDSYETVKTAVVQRNK
jgi:hypothetical protein